MGYYMSLAGLGLSRRDVVINGAIVSFNQCFGSCTGLNNFWRSISNLTLNVKLPHTHPAYAPAPPEDPGCANSNDLYAISQAAPIRRVHINGLFFLFDYCNTGFTSGGCTLGFGSKALPRRYAQRPDHSAAATPRSPWRT